MFDAIVKLALNSDGNKIRIDMLCSSPADAKSLNLRLGDLARKVGLELVFFEGEEALRIGEVLVVFVYSVQKLKGAQL